MIAEHRFMSFFPALLLLLIIMPLCCLPTGLLIVGRFRWNRSETLSGAIGVSLLLIYLLATAIYLSGIDWKVAWLLPIAGAASAVIARRDLMRILRARLTRQQILGYLFLLLIGATLLAIIQHYSGADWAGDWREHYERSLFFLHRAPPQTQLIGMYALPARPPMMNLIASAFMGIAAERFELFQFIFGFLNLLVVFPCVLLAGHLVKFAQRRVWIIVAMLALSPLVLQNATWTWTKLLSAFYVILAIAFYLRSLRKNDPRRMCFAAAMMAGAILVHYSAAVFAVAVGIHYLTVLRRRRHPAVELIGSAVVAAALLLTWFGWSLAVYGVGTTFGSNTTVTDTEQLTPIENLAKIGTNIIDTLIPHPLRLPMREFRLQYHQPNPFGLVRDYFFTLYQSNLLFALGSAGWVAILLLMRRIKIARFWLIFVPISILLGIAVHGAPDEFGLTHVTLQPLVLIGLTLLAAGMRRLPAWARPALLLFLAGDAVLGIVLQVRMESLPFALWPAIPGGASAEHGYQVIPFSKGMLSILAMQNSALRFQLGAGYFADPFTSLCIGLMLALVALLGAALIVLARGVRVGRGATAGAVALLLAGSAVVLSDRRLGFDASIPPNLPAAPRLSSGEVEQHVAPLKQIVATNPGSAEARYQLGQAYYNLRQLNEAAETLTDAFLLDPMDLKSRYLLELLLRTHSRNIADTPAAAAERYLQDPQDPAALQALNRARAARNLPVS
jgi:hypothetical protein